ncbi:MAG: NAD(P)-binding protein, partial [Acidimicrobiales bacterium]|nr:NAD(P)-binding protein [Acidimicrobiales bacterium]
MTHHTPPADVDEAELARVKERYAAERAKRMRADGNAQYAELSGDYEEYDRDPWVEPGFTREPVVEEMDVLIVGGGYSGMLASVHLKRRGVTDFRIVEKAGDFGGTW